MIARVTHAERMLRPCSTRPSISACNFDADDAAPADGDDVHVVEYDARLVYSCTDVMTVSLSHIRLTVALSPVHTSNNVEATSDFIAFDIVAGGWCGRGLKLLCLLQHALLIKLLPVAYVEI